MKENLIDPSLRQCDNKYCYLGNENGIFFADLDHLSYYGSQFFSDIFIKVGFINRPPLTNAPYTEHNWRGVIDSP